MSGDDIEGLLSRAETLLALRRWVDAERASREALAGDPASERGHAVRSLALAGQGRHGEAVLAADDGLARAPESEWLHRIRALALFHAGRHAEARAAAETAIGLEPRSAGAHHLRSMSLLALGDVAEAQAAAEEAVSLAPDSPELLAQLGNTCLRDSPAEAEAHFRASLALDPEQAWVLNNLGVALRRAGRADEASRALEASVLLDPEQDLAKKNLFAASNPVRRRGLHALVGLAVNVAGIALFVHAGVSPAAGWAFWAGGGLILAYVGTLAWIGRAASRRLARTDPQIHALRARIQADLDAGRISIGPAGRRLGTALGLLGALTVAAALALEAVMIRWWLTFPDRPPPAPLAGGTTGHWAALFLVLVMAGAILLAEGVKLWRQGAPRR
jgi:tetratricopeptide (TPR) repeat protein